MDIPEERVLSKEVVVEILSDVVTKENIINPTYDVSSGAGKGDGYLSFISRVDIKGTNKELSVVIKHAPKNEKMRELLPVTKIFRTEIRFYKEVIPLFEEFQKERNVKNPFKAIAKCYKTVGDNNEELLVLENIKANGFAVFDKSKQMDESHVKLVLREYGKLHAISYAMQEHSNSKFDELATKMENPFSIEDIETQFMDLQNAGLDKVMSLFDTPSDVGIYNALDNLKKTVLDFVVYVTEYKGNHPVITHGDCWCNNMMFKYQEGSTEPSELCLFDFQVSNLTSPAYDLVYFFYISASQDMLDNLDTYLQIYHDSLREHCLEMGTDVDKALPFSALQEEWKVFAKYGLLIGIGVFRVMLRDEAETLDFTDTKDGLSMTDLFMKNSKNEELINARYTRLVLHLYERGFL